MVDILQLPERHRQTQCSSAWTCPASDLVVGMQCGGSDAFSGVTANPAVGYASDLLVRCADGNVLGSDRSARCYPSVGPRAPSTKKLASACWKRWPGTITIWSWETDRSANPSLGNKKGGLANVVEKALGSIANSKSAIVEVLSPGQRPTKRGLIYAATPASDFVCRYSTGSFRHYRSGVHHRARHPLRADGGTGD